MTKNILDALYQSSLEPKDESEIIHVADLVDMAPNLHDFMRYEFWNGEPVEPPKLQFSVQGGLFWVGLSDSERSRSLRLECEGIQSGIATIEGLINSAQLQNHFRPWPGKGKTKGKNGTPSSKNRGTSTRTYASTSSRKRTVAKTK